jgi:hypothetical protein
MNHRYKIRMYESGDGDGSIADGTIVLAVDRGFSLDAASADDAERRIHKDVAAGKLEVGRVYEISPAVGNSELMRAIAFCSDSKAQRVILEAAKGMYSEFLRLRAVEPIPLPQSQLLEQYSVPA